MAETEAPETDPAPGLLPVAGTALAGLPLPLTVAVSMYCVAEPVRPTSLTGVCSSFDATRRYAEKIPVFAGANETLTVHDWP